MSHLTCFATSATSFTGRRVHVPALSCKPVPNRFSVRRTRASTVEPGSGTASETDKAVEITEAAPVSAESVQPVTSGKSEIFEDPVPGKIVLDELELAQQRTALEQYTAELRRERIQQEFEASRLFGFVPFAETLNGRLAMFFLMTGLLTEYWTGYSIPEQIELLARTLGIL